MTTATTPQAPKRSAPPEAAKPKRDVHWGWTISGGIITVVSLGCIIVEAVRNYVYGAKGAHDPLSAIVSGSSWAVFAVMLLVLQVIAKRRGGWTAPLFAFYLFCMAVTGYCGLAFYADDIRGQAREAMQVTQRFEDARRDLAAAEKERDEAREELRRAQAAADAITENTPSKDLQDLADKADAQAKAEATDQKRGAKCGDICRAAERERDAYLKRKPDALAKERQQARADEARARADAAQTRADTARAAAGIGPAEASGMAGLAQDVIGINAFVYASWEGLGKPVALVIGMLGGAGLFGEGLALLLFGLAYGRGDEKGEAMPQPRGLEVVRPPAKPATPSFPTSVTRLIPTAARGRKPLTKEERILQFAAERLRAGGGETLAGVVGDAFTSWWQAKYPGTEVPGSKTLAKVLMEDAGIGRVRRGGRNRYAAALLQ